MFWTIEDFNSGLCELADLGKPKPVQEAEPEVLPPVDLTKPLKDRLREDALQAYTELGGVEYLKRKPDLLDKILVKQAAPEPIAATINFPAPAWMMELAEKRLAYKNRMELAEDIEAKQPHLLPEPAAPVEDDKAKAVARPFRDSGSTGGKPRVR